MNDRKTSTQYLAEGVGELFKWLGIATMLCVIFAGFRGCTISKAAAQCPGGVCPAPSYSGSQPQWAPSPAWDFNPQSTIRNPQSEDHGWFKLQNGKLGLWHRGEYIGTLDPATMMWKHKDRPSVNLVESFGFKQTATRVPRPRECICKRDECDCAKCPNDCIVAKRIGDAAEKLSAIADRLAQADKETRGQGDNEKKSPHLPLAMFPTLRCGPDCPCGPYCDGNCNCCELGASGKKKPAVVVDESPPNYGMDWRAPSGGREVCTVNGARVSCQRLIEALGKTGGASDIPDDSRVTRLLLVSQDEKLRQALLHDAAKYDGKLIASAYAPDDWAVKWPGSSTPLFPMPADPTVYAINGDGKLVGHGTGYAGPADFDRYVAAADKLRDKPAADPLASPDLKAPPKSPTPQPAPAPSPTPVAPALPITPNHIGIAGLLGLAVAAACHRRRR